MPDEPPASANPTYLAKYKRMFDSYGWTPEWFAGQYSVADPDPAHALAAVVSGSDPQSSGAMSSAARRAPSGSTGR